ncbi:hypothetical protein ACQCN2_06705 [Brevibacillus ginsengisoli]|uniref:hypothetical protein n=1 Tax=Brevibacillus ginsengisoli TaxID=363854 RepID=UPI003CEDB776
MSQKEVEQQIIQQYQRDEGMMILVFAQWCVNYDLDPLELYNRAYPAQPVNQQLKQMLEVTVPKEEAGDIPDETLLSVLSLFGNEDLAFVVTQEIEKRNA